MISGRAFATMHLDAAQNLVVLGGRGAPNSNHQCTHLAHYWIVTLDLTCSVMVQ
jgi:hypothetical protein